MSGDMRTSIEKPIPMRPCRFPVFALAGLLLAAALLGGCEKDGAKAQSSSGNGATAVGTIDINFNTVGFNIFPVGITFAAGRSLAVNPTSGKIAVAGFGNGVNDDMAIWQVRDNGTFDPAFNAGNPLLYDDGGSAPNNFDSADAVVVRGNGNIVIGGYTQAGGSQNAHIREYTAAGVLTGMGGFSQGFTCGGGTSQMVAMAIQPDNKIVATGVSSTQLVVWRFNPNGTLDTATPTDFNATGFNCQTLGSSGDVGLAITLDKQGRAVVAAQSSSGSISFMSLWRFTTGGIPDPGFNGGNPVSMSSPLGGNIAAGNGVAVDSQGRIIVVGSASNGFLNDDAIVWRFTSAGVPDLSFGGTGYVAIGDFPSVQGNQRFNAVAIDAMDRIVAVGEGMGPGDTSGQSRIYVARFLDDGGLDNSFGPLPPPFPNNRGLLFLSTGGPIDDHAKAMQIDIKGRIVITGSMPTGPSMSVWRLD